MQINYGGKPSLDMQKLLLMEEAINAITTIKVVMEGKQKIRIEKALNQLRLVREHFESYSEQIYLSRAKIIERASVDALQSMRTLVSNLERSLSLPEFAQTEAKDAHS